MEKDTGMAILLSRLRASAVAILVVIAALMFLTTAPALADGPSDEGGSTASDAGGTTPSIAERTTIYDETGLLDQESLKSTIGNLKNVPDSTRIAVLVSDDLDPNSYDQSVVQRLEALNRDIVSGGQLQVNHVIIAVSPNLRKIGFYVGDAQPYPNGIKENVINAMKPHAQNGDWGTTVIAGLSTYFMATAPGGGVAAAAPSTGDDSLAGEYFGMSSSYWKMIGMMLGAPLAILVIVVFFYSLGAMKKKRDMKHLANMTPRGRRLWDEKFRPELEAYASKINSYAYDVDSMTYVPENERARVKEELRNDHQRISTIISDAGSMRGNAATSYKEAVALYTQVETRMARWGREQIKEHLGDIQQLAAKDSNARSRLNQNQSTTFGDIWIPVFLMHYVASQTPGTNAYERIHSTTQSGSSDSSSYSPSSYGDVSGGSSSF